MDLNFWKLKERNSREKKTITHRGRSIGNAHNITKSDIADDVETFAHGWLCGVVRLNASEWIPSCAHGAS